MTTPTVYLSVKKEAFRYFALAEDAADIGPHPRIRLGGCYAKDEERMRHDETESVRAVAHNVATIPRSSKQKVINPLNADSKGEYDLGEYRVGYDADREGVVYVVFASNDSGGLSGHRNVDFGPRAEVTKQGSVKPVSVTVTWVVKWSWVADEYHKARSFRTLLMSAMGRVLVHAPRSETKILLISGTALSTSWKSSFEGPARCTLPADRDSSRYPLHRFSHSYLMRTIILRVERLSRGSDTNEPEEERMEHTKEMVGICNLMMTRREAGDTYNGKVILSLPPLATRCRFTIRNKAAYIAWSTRREQQWRLVERRVREWGAQAKLKAAVAASVTKAFTVTVASFASNFPGVGPDKSVRVNLMTDMIGDISDSDLRQWTPVSKVIDELTEGCGKIKALEKILRPALEDCSPPYGSKSSTAYKKNGVVFWAPPGSAYILRAHCDKHYSDDWNVAVITASMAPEKHSQVILDIIDEEIALGAEKKPTLLIAAVRAIGLDVNGLQGASYAVIFDLPYEESPVRQAFGRVCRSGQVSKCHGYVLVSMDTGMEE
jgi:hypothetical protein